MEFAEETGHIKPLSEWVLRRAKRDYVAFLGRGHDLEMSINLSGRLVSDREFIEWSIRELGDLASHFCFELTETAVINDQKTAIDNMNLLREAGIRISIDDYGAGLSSLAYLKQIPAHELKIDKSFVISLSANSSDALLIKSTIDLAHSLNMKVVAEGVETEAVLRLLSALGADTAQGYFLARPAGLEDILTFLDNAPEVMPKLVEAPASPVIGLHTRRKKS